MTKAPHLRIATAADAVPAADGRHRRSQDSRARIVAALLDLVHGGEISPAAEQVAARAGVGLRSVFRHFSDMDSLYLEMAAYVEREFVSVLSEPLTGADWRARLVEMLHRRIGVYEKIAPYRRAGDAIRHRSPFIAANQARFVAMTRDLLRRQLPPEVIRDRTAFEALDLIMSFEAWSRLRREQGLSAKRAADVLEGQLRKQTGELGGPRPSSWSPRRSPPAVARTSRRPRRRPTGRIAPARRRRHLRPRRRRRAWCW